MKARTSAAQVSWPVWFWICSITQLIVIAQRFVATVRISLKVSCNWKAHKALVLARFPGMPWASLLVPSHDGGLAWNCCICASAGGTGNCAGKSKVSRGAGASMTWSSVAVASGVKSSLEGWSRRSGVKSASLEGSLSGLSGLVWRLAQSLTVCNPSDEISIPDPAKVVMLWKQLSAWDCWKSGMQYAGTSGGNDRSKKWDVVTNLLLLKSSPNPTTNLSLNSCEFASKLTRAGIAP